MIRFRCAESGAESYADLVADSVQEITLNGRRIDPAEAYAEGRIALRGLKGGERAAGIGQSRVRRNCRRPDRSEQS